MRRYQNYRGMRGIQIDSAWALWLGVALVALAFMGGREEEER